MGTLQWFGRTFNTPMYDGMEECTESQVGKTCALCDEPILVGEAGVTMPHIMTDGAVRLPQHIECHIRSILGSIEHLHGQCSCHGGEDNPRGQTYRESAREVIEHIMGVDWMIRP